MGGQGEDSSRMEGKDRSPMSYAHKASNNGTEKENRIGKQRGEGKLSENCKDSKQMEDHKIKDKATKQKMKSNWNEGTETMVGGQN